MRLAVSLGILLAAAVSREGCGRGPAPHDPCAARSCGDPCTVCPPDDPGCVETAVVKACDPSGRCVADVPGLCHPGADPCAGKACGAACVIEPPCRDDVPPCMAPSVLGHCDPAGACLAVDPPPPGFCPSPPWSCEGKACGDPCGICPPDTDPALCPVPTFAPTACDFRGECVTFLPWLCYDPCAGKACGADCRLCPPDATGCGETTELKACDAAGRCVSRPPDLWCP